jgi:hypothetical protein
MNNNNRNNIIAIIMLIMFLVVLFNSCAFSGDIKMDEESINAYSNTPTALDAEEASKLVHYLKGKYIDKNKSLVILTKPKRDKIYLYVYDMFELNRQDELVKLITEVKKSFSSKPICIYFSSNKTQINSGDNSQDESDVLLRKVELKGESMAR